MEKTRTSSEKQDLAQAVIDEHKSLHGCLDKIDAALASPPAALEEARRYLKSGMRPSRSSRSPSADFIPTVMSVVTVEGPCPEPSKVLFSRSTARSLV